MKRLLIYDPINGKIFGRVQCSTDRLEQLYNSKQHRTIEVTEVVYNAQPEIFKSVNTITFALTDNSAAVIAQNQGLAIP